jgi:hypothetical protein
MDLKRMSQTEQVIFNELLTTWQPVAAIAVRSNVPVKTSLKILLGMEARGIVKKVRVRIDGHNKVHCFKKIEYLKVLGVVTTIEKSDEE